MAATERLIVKIDADSKGLQVELQRVGGAVTKFSSSVDTASNATAKFKKHQNSLVGGFRETVVALSSLQTLFYQYSFFLGGFTTAVVKAGAEFERLHMLMKGMAKGSTEAARTLEANSGLDFIRKLAREVPFSLDAIADSFVKLKSGGIDPTKGSLQGLIDATAKVGGTSEQLKRAAIAIQQMAGKGVVSMEELRQQLGEAIPTATQDMAFAVGMSMRDFVKAVSQGSIRAKPALNALFAEWRRNSSGAAEAMMNTFNGMFSQLKSAFFNFALQVDGLDQNNEFTKSGFFGTLRAQMQDLINFLNSPEGANFGRNIGNGLKDAVVAISETIQFLYKFRDVVVIVGKVLLLYLGLKTFRGIVQGLTAMVGSLANVQKALAAFSLKISETALKNNALGNSLTSGNSKLLTFGNAAAGASAGIGRFAGGLATFGTRVLAFLGWAGAIAAAVTALISLFNSGTTAAQRFRNASDRVAEGQVATDDELKDDNSDMLVAKAKFAQFKKGNLANLKVIEDKRAAHVALNKKEQEVWNEYVRLNTDRLKKESTYNTEYTTKQRDSNDRRNNAAIDELQRNLDKDLRANTIDYDNKVRAIKDRQDKGEKVSRQEISQLQIDKDKKDTSARIKAANTANQMKSLNGAGFTTETRQAVDKWAADQRKDAGGIQDVISGVPTLDDLLMDGNKKAKKDPLEGLRRTFSSVLVEKKRLEEELKGNSDAFDDNLDAIQRSADATAEAQKSEVGLRDAIRDHRAEIRQLNSDIKVNKAINEMTSDIELQKKELGSLFDSYTKGYETVESRVASYESRLRDQRSEELKNQKHAAEMEQKILEEVAIERRKIIVGQATEIKQKNEDLINALLNEDQVRQRVYDKEVERVSALIEWAKKEGVSGSQIVADLQTYLANLEKDKKFKDAGPLAQWANDAKDWQFNLKEGMSGIFTGFFDDLARGKFAFKDFAKSILRMLMQIIVKALIARAIMSALGMGAGPVAAPVGAVSSGKLSGMTGSYTMDHTGGVIGSGEGSTRNGFASMFAFAKRYHNGGFPGLKDGEVPIIAKKGEGVFTPEQMKALGRGGGGTAPNVQVNVINQSSQDVNAQKGDGARFDGEKWVMDIVLKNAVTPGPMRDMLQGIKK